MTNISSYDYTCPHCKVTTNTDTNMQIPQVGESVSCGRCEKTGKIVYAKVVYEVVKVE